MTNKPRFEPDDQALFFEELGRALSTWGAVEAILAEIYGDAVNDDNPIPAKVAFWTIVAFEGKRQVADAAVRTVIANDAELLTKWQALFGTLKSKAGTRNKLAHGTVVSMSWNTPKGMKSATRFAPQYYQDRTTKEATTRLATNPKPRYRDPRPKGSLSLNQIIQFRKDYAQLRQDLLEFLGEFRHHIRG